MLSKKNQRRQKSGKKALRHVGVSLAVAGILGISPYAVPQLYAASLGGSDVLNVGTGSVDENKAYNENLSLDGGTVNFGSNQDKAGTVTSTGNVVMNGGTITVSGSGDKVSGAILMGGEANKNNPHTPQVVPGSTNTFIPDPNPALVPPVHSVTAAQGMTINNVSVNIGAPTYGAGGPAQSDIDKSWEGLRLDLKTSGGDMAIKGGDFRVANIAFPIKQEANAALRFESAGSITVSDGQFTAQGQPVPNPARSNYDAPSLISFKATNDLVIDGGTFDIQTARVHMTSTEGKVVFNDGTFNINSKSPYPGWKTFEKGTGGQPNTIYTEGESSQTATGVFGSLDTSGSVVEINGGTFNLGTPGETTANYFNLADKTAIFNGGTFNLYTNSNFGNNKADLIIKGGEYNLIDGGYFGGRNYNGAALDIQGGTFNFDGGQGLFGYSIGVITEAAQLNNDKYNKASIDISGGTFNYTSKNDSKLEVSTIYVGYQLNISGGEFVRKSDGVNSITAAFKVTGQGGSVADSSGDMNISGGIFRTEKPVNYTEGVVTTRNDNIKLYKQTGASTGLSLYTAAEVNALFDANDPDAIKTAFSPANDPSRLPTREEVLKALEAAGNLATISPKAPTSPQEGWNFDAARNMNITGGHFDLTTANASTFTAGGSFNFANATLISAGGGGPLTIKGKDGINLTSGVIHSLGSDANGAYVIKYDDRGQANRDRWTLGKYMYLMTDGDITLGTKGSAVGPEVYFRDGMMFFNSSTGGQATGNLYLYSGSLTLDGQYRSTLNTGSMANSIIDGGTLNVLTHDRLNRVAAESASMWLMPVELKSGTINLYNGQLGGDTIVMDGGVINAMGDSSINANAYVPTSTNPTTGVVTPEKLAGKVTLNAGIVNLDTRAYIGAIKGDSKDYSAYVTGTKDIALGKDLTVNMKVNAPASGTNLVVGTDIGGIYAISTSQAGVATIDPTSIVIADGTSFNISNPTVLAPGDYTAVNFIEAQNGVLTMSNKNTDSLFYSMNINKNSDNKSADLSLNVKNPVSVIGNLPGSDNVRDNALGFAELLRNAKGNWASVASNVAHASAAEAAETLRQIGGENTTATAQSLVTSVGEFRGRMQAQGKANISGLASGDSVYSKEYRAWISGMGSWGNQASSGGRTGFDSSSAGVAMGFDRTFADRYLLGLGLGYAKGYAESKDGLSDTNSDTWFVSLYTSLDFDPVVIDADVTYANTQSQIKSDIVSGGQNYENSGDFGVDSWSASIKGSYIFRFNDNATKIAPYVGIDFLSIQQHGYTEDGPLARSFGSDFSTLWTLPVGVKASHEFRGQNWTFTPEVGVGYARDLNEFKPAARVTVPGITNTEIKTYGSKLAPDSFRGNAGFSLKCNDSVEFYGMYNLDARDKFTNHSVNVGFSYSF